MANLLPRKCLAGVGREMLGCLYDDEDVELEQMVNDFMEPCESTTQALHTSATPTSSSQYTQQTQVLALQEIVRCKNEGERRVAESVSRQMRRLRSTAILNQNNGCELKKWLVMKLRRDGFDASLCRTSWATSFGCPAGEYVYIDVIVEDENHGGGKRLVVDTEFKSQFELARPTGAYKELADTLPCTFVGDEQKLNAIITLLCAAAKQSFRESSLHVPPWRTKTYMRCKWLARSHSSGSSGIVAREERTKQKNTGFNGSALCNGFAKTGIDCR